MSGYYAIGGPFDMPSAPQKPRIVETYEGFPISTIPDFYEFEGRDVEGFQWEHGDAPTLIAVRDDIDAWILAKRIEDREEGPPEPIMPWEELQL